MVKKKPLEGTRAVSVCLPLVLLGASVLGLGGCEPSPNVSSETHFLRWCPERDACGGGLTCVCGACAPSCATDRDCSDLAEGAVCLPAEGQRQSVECSEAPVDASCELPCASDSDCEQLGAGYLCDQGFCRALASDCEGGQAAATDVILLGDNFLADSGEIRSFLEELAREAGALAGDERYRDYSSTLVTPFGGGADLTVQYAAAVEEGAVRVAVLDVGGPDALLPCPEPPAADCPALVTAQTGAADLLSTLENDGVTDAVLFFYPNPEDEALRANFDVLRPMMQSVCDEAPLDCHFLDLRPVFDGNEAEYLEPGGVLPTQAGAEASARAIWSVMQRSCVAQ